MTGSNVEAVDGADVVLLSLKPQTLTKVGHELAGHLKPSQLVVSIVAGANCKVLQALLDHRPVVRSMPNTPAQIGRGMTVWYATPEVSEEQIDQAKVLLRALGAELQVEDERFVEMATAVSGTGPAYVFLVMEALIDAAVHLGFPRHVAYDLVIETLEGSTAFAKATAQHPAVLRNMVTSPGGTSAAAIHELESGRLRTVLSEAVWASYRRTVELGLDLEKGLGIDEGSIVASADGRVAKAADTKASTRRRDGH
jgi:pyrroline-5-carboxylate reductase